uniref:ribosomal protein L22 n=1 Tax=Cuscuta polyanthemos TaxID=437288 RepID=UPI002436035D|nr:ribosomal protein L22 [Cuscuta polyanthemos]WEY30487.1 ribosomal protein L22 [Cuscuta polyanthemos]
MAFEDLTKTNPKVYAFRQHISISADKARRIIDQIRGCSYEETVMILELLPYRAAYPIFKMVYSAASNASYVFGSNKGNLFLIKAQVNQRTGIKKLKPQARGRSYPIKRATCDIIIVLTDLSLSLNPTELIELKKAIQKKNDPSKSDSNRHKMKWLQKMRSLWDKK